MAKLPPQNLPFPPSPEEIEAQRRHLAVGRLGEELAARFLWGRGFRIIERNFRAGSGEIDLIAEKKGRIHFVEVKTRSDDSFGPPEDRVDARKRRVWAEAAERFLAAFPDAPAAGYQFDVLAQVVQPETKKAIRQEYLENAL